MIGLEYIEKIVRTPLPKWWIEKIIQDFDEILVKLAEENSKQQTNISVGHKLLRWGKITSMKRKKLENVILSLKKVSTISPTNANKLANKILNDNISIKNPLSDMKNMKDAKHEKVALVS